MRIYPMLAGIAGLFFAAITPAMAFVFETDPSVPTATVPEPSSLALIAIGVVGARVLSRRKR